MNDRKPGRKALLLVAILSSLWRIALGQPEQLLDDPILYDQLAGGHQDHSEVGKLLTSVELDCRFYENATSSYALYDDGTPSVLFTSVRTNWTGYKFFPNIVVQIDGRWMRFPIPETRDGWTYVHASRDRNNLLVAMDNIPESAGHQLRLLISDDGGRNWRYVESLQKYAYMDTIKYFKMDEHGNGEAVEYNPGDTFNHIATGFYVHTTNNWGVTWLPSEHRESFDPTGFANVYDKHTEISNSDDRLANIRLPGFSECERNPTIHVDD